MNIWLISLIIFAYFTGAPLGYYVGRLKTGKDIRYDFPEIDTSTSAGTTHAKRIFGIRWALLICLGDIAKGTLPTFLAIRFWGLNWTAGLVGLASLFGNIFPVLIQRPLFKGGKGVATTGGVFIPMVAFSLAKYHPLWLILIFVIIIAIWIFFVWLCRKENHRWMVLASAFLVSAMIVFFGILESQVYIGLVFLVYLMSIIVICAHFENWRKLKDWITKHPSGK